MVLLIILGCLLIVVGLIGCVVPGLMGPPFIFYGDYAGHTVETCGLGNHDLLFL